ncbi:MAG: hypothetical protein HYY16_17405 [Planctomycetes bacterium]|nr:hypothetical protein [Planctomycetota bacterium]
MIRFKWKEWNLDKIAAHGLSREDVETAYDRRLGLHQERADGSYLTLGVTPAGRVIAIIWRYDQEFDALADSFEEDLVFIITAY